MGFSFLNLDRCFDLLKIDEGEVLTPYKDSEGNLTIGVGHLLSNGISREVSKIIFYEDFLKSQMDCWDKIPCYANLNEARRYVLANMCFNIGISRLLGFKKMLSALDKEDYSKAAEEMMDSKWAVQVKSRATRLKEIMIKGEY